LALVLMMLMPGTAQPSDKPTIINLMIDAQCPSSPTKEQVNEAKTNLENIYNKINNTGLVATIFSTQDTLLSDLDLTLTRIGLRSRFELAMSGSHSNENISTMPYSNQSDSLRLSKKWVEGARVCGMNNITVYGFMPQSFDQNQDTYKVLDDLGLQYDAGFQAGLIYAPGHENDVWPYLLPGHKFYAVPVSTTTLGGKKVVLQDSYFKDNGMSSSQWYDALAAKFDEIQGKDEPMVISLTTSVSGSGDYLDALKKFMDYAISKKASFVTTTQLVEMAKTGVHDASALSATKASTECPTCGQGVSITPSVTNITANSSTNCSTCGKNTATAAGAATA
jgi:hypothetical protein